MYPHPHPRHADPRRTLSRAARRTSGVLVVGLCALVAPVVASGAGSDEESTPAPRRDSMTAVPAPRSGVMPLRAAVPERAAVVEAARSTYIARTDRAARVLAAAVAELERAADRELEEFRTVLLDTYAWDERSFRVGHLQAELGLVVDGWYSHSTHRAHLAALTWAKLPTDGVPEAPAYRGPSEAAWAALRRCESSGNYSIVNRSGKYRGAYQFDRPTWNEVARRHDPRLVGVDPAAASPADQDAMARALYEMRGARPWPQCGRHLG
jgi:hypothetical protein